MSEISQHSVNVMSSKSAKPREFSDELLLRAGEFHGHGGPFLVVGLRMGLRALRDLDACGWLDLRCRAHLRRSPPDSCVLDGIQVATGCTMGKMNMEVSEGEGVSAEFEGGRGATMIELRREAEEEIRRSLREGEEADRLLKRLIEARDDDLFTVSLTLRKEEK
jgi:formylmethanofuran dehydrogenase subunit E